MPICEATKNCQAAAVYIASGDMTDGDVAIIHCCDDPKHLAKVTMKAVALFGVATMHKAMPDPTLAAHVCPECGEGNAFYDAPGAIKCYGCGKLVARTLPATWPTPSYAR